MAKKASVLPQPLNLLHSSLIQMISRVSSSDLFILTSTRNRAYKYKFCQEHYLRSFNIFIESPEIGVHMKYPELALEIDKMADEDQAMRKCALENGGVVETEWDDGVDHRNTNRMKEIVEEIGWPTVSKVGQEAAHMAWLLVQHADHDVEFQKQCLTLMKGETHEEVDPADTAYLDDRVRVNEGKPQLYGTQFHVTKEGHLPRPIEDPENLDARRLSVGMQLFEDYKRSLKKYKMQ